MSNPITKIFDATTGETIERPMTDNEYADFQIRLQDIQNEKVIEAALKAQKQAILNRLGLTEDELRIVLG